MDDAAHAQIRAQGLRDIWISNVRSKVMACATKTNKQMKTLVPVHLHTQTANLINPYQIDYEGIVMAVISCSQVATTSENDDGSD